MYQVNDRNPSWQKIQFLKDSCQILQKSCKVVRGNASLENILTKLLQEKYFWQYSSKKDRCIACQDLARNVLFCMNLTRFLQEMHFSSTREIEHLIKSYKCTFKRKKDILEFIWKKNSIYSEEYLKCKLLCHWNSAQGAIDSPSYGRLALIWNNLIQFLSKR